MSQETLSVIMANYNHAHYLPETLGAILNQSYKPLEVIVVDDGSTDNSVEVIEQFVRKDSVVRLLRNETNRGALFSIHRALEHASGAYVYSSSADDKALPGFFEKSMSLLAQHSQAGLCCSEPASFDGVTGIVSENPMRLSDQPAYFSPVELVELMRRRGVHIAGHTSIVKRPALLEAGGFVPELKWHCDWFALLVVAFRCGICYIPEPLATIRLLPNSYSASGTRDWTVQRRVLDTILHIVKSPQYRDVRPNFERSQVLAGFGWSMLRVILANPAHWHYLSLDLLRRINWWQAVFKFGLYPVWYRLPISVRRAYRWLRNRSTSAVIAHG